MHRRTFLKNSAYTAAGVTILNFPVFGKNAPSNKVILAVMGVNSRGAFLAKSFASLPCAELAYICDVEDQAIRNGLEAVKEMRRQPAVIKDIRELLTKTDFDALVIAAPDHWHAPATLMALAHGKHVYVEKPCSHNPEEGEMLVKAMNKYDKVITMGNQRRSFPNLMQAVKEVREGLIGKAYYGKAWYANNRKPIGYGKKVPVPATLDFELWQGPAPRRDYMDNLVHYNWHWFWHWGTGESNNNGAHEIDCCRWFLGVDYPTKVTSAGGRYSYQDDWEAFDTQVATFEFGNEKAISWESRSCNLFPFEGAGRGFSIHGDKGTLVNAGGDDYKIFDADNKLVKEVKSEVPADPTNPVSASGNIELYHFDNFIKTVKGEAKNNSPIDEGHKTNLLCHLANIAQRTGTTLHCDPSNGHIRSNKKARQLWGRRYEKGWELRV